MTSTYDVCIRGSGIVGRTLALHLAAERLRVALVTSPQAQSGTPSGVHSDVRAYALNAKSKALLDAVRCWPQADHATPVLDMLVRGDNGGEVQFRAADHSPAVSALAWIVDVPALQLRLVEATRFQPLIEELTQPEPAALTVVCEGKASATRAELGVDYHVTPYGQHAIAARVHCEQPHQQRAHQWFSNGDILAFLPLGGAAGNSMALVWSVKQDRADQLMSLEPEPFTQQLQEASHGVLGALTLTSARAAWPLQLARADRWVGQSSAGSWALAGDAAHTVHPLSGQGLNLGLADVAQLTQVLRERAYWRTAGDRKLLRQYERARRGDVLATGSVTDGLQQLFAQTPTAWQTLRNWGMTGFNASGPLKNWLTQRAMGLG